MSDKEKGLYGKFRVRRTDGKSEYGKKHYNCSYFCLDLDHDKFAVPALQAYADACSAEYPQLANDLRETAQQMQDAIKAGEHPSCEQE